MAIRIRTKQRDVNKFPVRVRPLFKASALAGRKQEYNQEWTLDVATPAELHKIVSEMKEGKLQGFDLRAEGYRVATIETI